MEMYCQLQSWIAYLQNNYVTNMKQTLKTFKKYYLVNILLLWMGIASRDGRISILY